MANPDQQESANMPSKSDDNYHKEANMSRDSSQDQLHHIEELCLEVLKQNRTIQSQMRSISTDVGVIKRDLSKVGRIVSKLETVSDRDMNTTNTLVCELRTFSCKVMSSLDSLAGKNDASEFVDGHWNVYFHGENSVLSNFYVCHLVVGGIEFKTAEHLYQYKKAEFHSVEHDIGRDIINAGHGGSAKAIASRNIQVSPEWEKAKEEVMLDILRVKAEQCRKFSEELLSTGQRPLIHDLPIYVWGWGTNGEGKNLMGKLLEKVRSALQDGSITPGVFQEHPKAHTESVVTQKDTESPSQMRSHHEEEEWTTDEYPSRSLRKEDYHSEEGPMKRGSNRSKDYHRDYNPREEPAQIANDDDWPDLPTPGKSPANPRRHVTSDDSGGSLRVKIDQGEEYPPQPFERQSSRRNRGGRSYERRKGDRTPDTPPTNRTDNPPAAASNFHIEDKRQGVRPGDGDQRGNVDYSAEEEPYRGGISNDNQYQHRNRGRGRGGGRGSRYPGSKRAAYSSSSYRGNRYNNNNRYRQEHNSSSWHNTGAHYENRMYSDHVESSGHSGGPRKSEESEFNSPQHAETQQTGEQAEQPPDGTTRPQTDRGRATTDRN